MKFASIIMLACVMTGLAYAQRSPAFAKDDRVVTLEHWGRKAATVWAVQSDRIVVYRVFDTAEPDQFLAEVPITKEQGEKIRISVRALSNDVRGRVYMPRGVSDGTMLRVSFTPDGHFANDRIEVQNLWLSWLEGLSQAISETMPEAFEVRFKEQIDERNRMLNWPTDWPTDTITIEKYYEVPNQSSQPTPGS